MMHRLLTAVVCLALLLLLAQGAAADVSPKQVQTAIDKAKAWLYSQEKNGNWEVAATGNPKGDPWDIRGAQWGGQTALATYALLAAGESNQEPHVAAAIEWLEKADIVGFYALGMRANVWELAPKNKDIKKAIDKDGRLLVEGLKSDPEVDDGFYNYTIERLNDKHSYDHSVSQYGVLGTWAAAECDYEVPGSYWERVEKAWIREQGGDGGWGYQRGVGSSASMTAAGVATLFITQDFLHMHEGIDCRGNLHNAHIDAGMKWLADHFGEVNNCYTWYGIERIATAGGYKYIGNHNWFQQGAQALISSQGGGGDWAGDHPGVPNTCFALLFLARGREPVMINKLQYSIFTFGDIPKEANWDERLRDTPNLVRWSGHALERWLNWQIVNLGAPIEDLHDAPILYIAGDSRGLQFTPEEEGKLKQFVEEGGLILGNADCGSKQFSKAFRKLGNTLFPDYEFRDLPKNHLLFHNAFDRSKWTDPVALEGMSNGARELMLLFSENDPPRYWQSRTVGGREGSHQIMINIYMYVTDKQQLRYKGETYILRPNGGGAGKSIKVARLRYQGIWNPEPGGSARFATYMHNNDGTDLAVDTVTLGEGKLAGYKIAHMTGDSRFALNAAEQAEMRNFVQGGGTLIIDACGGSPEFAASAETALAQTFGQQADQLKTPLKMTHLAFQAAAFKIEAVGYRNFAMKILGQSRQPRIRGIDFNGRTGVFYSQEDLSEGLVGQYVDGIYGYQPLSTKETSGRPVAGASEIMAGLVTYGSNQ